MIEEKKKSSNGSKVLWAVGLILCIIFGFLLFCNCVIIVKGMIAPEKPPSVFGTTPMVVLSGSMSGTAEDHIEVGDLIFVGKADPDQLEVGDVIAFMSGHIVVTHRIVGIETSESGERMFTTRGDANNTADDEPVTADNLVGIYKGRIPKAGDFAMFLQTPLGMVLFIGVPLLAFIIFDILHSRKNARKELEKTEALEAEVARLRELAKEVEDKNEKQ